MDIIQKIIPKNPISSDMLNRITQRCEEVIKYFVGCYAKQTQLVIVENKEEEYEEKEKRKEYIQKDKEKKEKYYKSKFGEDADVPNIPEKPEKDASREEKTEYCKKILELGFKPLFPRGKMEPLKPPELQIKLSRYIIRDKEYDPYAVYVLKATKGKESAEKERRFREFEKLNKALKKVIPKDVTLPPASSKIGVRNLSEDFLKSRVVSLNEYLQKIAVIPEVENDEAFQKFIGLFPNDPLDEKIFDAAYRRTRYHFWCWFDSKYDTPGDAISKLITRVIWNTVSSDIYSALPNAEAPRRASIKLAYKLIAGVVDKAVPAAWDKAYSASKKVRDTIIKALDKVIEIIITTKNDLNNKLKDKMMDSFAPIKENIGKLFAAAIHKIVPPIVEPFAFIYKTYAEKSEPLIIESFKNCDTGKLNEAVDILNKIHEDIVNKLKAKVDEQLKIVCDNLKGTVSLTLLQDCFNPMKAIGRIIADFVKMINPEHWSKVAIKMFDYKKKLSDNDGQDVDNVLIEMERNALYEMRWQSYSMDNGRYWLRHDIYSLGLGLDSIADVCFDLGRKLIKQVYKKSCKKFIRKFSDYVWGFKNKNEDDKPWSEKVDEAFMLAYKAAKHKFNKECGNIIKTCVCDILNSTILNKVIEEINKVLEPILQALTDKIPENIKDMVDIEEMAKDDIEEVLTQTFEGAVNDQDEPFVEELNKAIENCQI